MHYIGIAITLTGAIISLYTSIPNAHIIKKGILDLKENRQTEDFIAPVESVLKVKLNGKRKQKMIFALRKTKRITSMTGNWQTTGIQRQINGNSKLKLNLQRDDSYSFIIQPDVNESPFIPFTVDYNIFEYDNRSDRLFQIGLTLVTSGLVIYFAT